MDGGLRKVLLHMIGRLAVFPLHCNFVAVSIVSSYVGECQQRTSHSATLHLSHRTSQLSSGISVEEFVLYCLLYSYGFFNIFLSYLITLKNGINTTSSVINKKVRFSTLWHWSSFLMFLLVYIKP